ncbi:hypothetical protein VHEMI10344 [[Torrubiella] hemipterigena]|uniref:Uncharacterized protein n=1 Tax=[Torrubiella] hemipterigena TaxID=1531966 RepID=A0A0A1TRQ0_9HYPO|nr:hypothetical protein VHEMI10344 [[Torrubiella] hemipterigena]
MDFVKKAVSAVQENTNKNTNTNPPPQTEGGEGGAPPAEGQAPPAQGGAGQQDYVDKAFDFVAKKSGHTIDRDTEEKITDQGRAMFEKATGKKVPEKFSN